VLVSTASSAAVLCLALANNVALARRAGADGRGVYALATAALLLAWPVVTAGTPVAIVRFLGRKMDPRAVRGLGLVLLAGATCVFGALALARQFVPGPWGGLGPEVWGLLLVTVPPAAYHEYARFTFLGTGDLRRFNGVHLLSIGALTLANATLATPDPTRIVAILAAVWWSVAAVEVVAHLRAGVALPRRFEVRALLAFGRRSAVARLAELGLVRADYLLLPFLVGLGPVGVYAIADQVAQALAFLAVTAGRVLQRFVASQDDAAASAARTARTSRLFVAVALAVGTAGALGGAWGFPALFGEAFAGASLGFVLLLPALVARAVGAVVGPYLEGLGHAQPPARAAVIALAAQLTALVPAVLLFGWWGAAVVKSGAFVLQALLLVRACPAGTRALGLWRPRLEDLAAASAVLRRLAGPRPSPETEAAP